MSPWVSIPQVHMLLCKIINVHAYNYTYARTYICIYIPYGLLQCMCVYMYISTSVRCVIMGLMAERLSYSDMCATASRVIMKEREQMG